MMLPWPATCTLAALILLLVLIIRYKLDAFVALVVVSLGLGLAAGLAPVAVLRAIGRGVGDIMGSVAVILALGAMLGRMLDVSGAARVIAQTLVNRFGVERASLAVLVAAYLVGIPVLFNVGFLLLIPIMWQLQRDTGKSLLFFVLPFSFSLATTHSLIPPHPGIVGAVNALTPEGDTRSMVMVSTIVFGTLMGIPIALVGWFGPGRWWARRQFVAVPEALAAKTEASAKRAANPAAPPAASTAITASLPAAPEPEVRQPSFGISVLIVTMPLLLSLIGFGAQLLRDLRELPEWMYEPPVKPWAVPAELVFLAHSPLTWLEFLGHPTMALLLPTGLAFLLLGLRRGLGASELSRVAGGALQDVGSILFLFGAAGGFMQVISETGGGAAIARLILGLPMPKVVVFFLVAVLMRVALGSATAAILTASALLRETALGLPGQETLLVLAVANGVTVMTQPADSGFWMVKEYCNLSVRDVMVRFNLCRITMALTGLVLLLLYQAAEAVIRGLS